MVAHADGCGEAGGVAVGVLGGLADGDLAGGIERFDKGCCLAPDWVSPGGVLVLLQLGAALEVGVLALLCLCPSVGVLLHLALLLSHGQVGGLDGWQESLCRGSRGRSEAYYIS